MEEQKVYVVYKDGQPYIDRGKKIAYLQERYAKQLITIASKEKAEFLYEPTRFNGKEMISDIRWSKLRSEERQYWIDKAREQFEIKVFVEEKSNESIDESINYKKLADYVQLAIDEYEFNNNTNIEGYSFNDLISWLDHFGYCNASRFVIKQNK